MFIKDRQEIGTNRQYSDEGFLVVPATISRTGIQEYYAGEMGLTDRDSLDIVKVFRPEEEVFSKDSLSSFANKPVTDNHPPELVNAKNSKKFSVGHSGPEVTKDGIFAKTILHITDAEAIKKVEDGKSELSNGYVSDIEWKAGVTPDGEQYDAVQRNIRGNHIAIVDKGRCGSACKLSDQKPNSEEPIMAKITIGGVDYEVSDQAAQAVGNLQVALSDAEKEAEKATKEKDEEVEKAKGKKETESKDHQKALDTLQAKFDDSQSKIPGPDMLDTLVANRMATRDAALKINPSFKHEGKDCETIRKEVVGDTCKEVDVATATVDYIRARFDALGSVAKESSTLDGALKKNLENKDDDKGVVSADASRQAFIKRSANAWKPGGAK